MKYLALLRGINVGGHRKIKMRDLKLLLEDLNFKNITTYIQSGNVVFSSPKEVTEVELEKAIFNTFGFDVKVIVLKEKELENIIANNTFVNAENIKQNYVTFFKGKTTMELKNKFIENYTFKDQYEIKDSVVYILYSDKISTSKLNNKLLENKLNLVATTRNWNTTLKLLELIKNN